MRKHFWKPALALAFFIGVTLWYAYWERDQLTNQPCESYANARLDRVPARCLKHFIDR